MDSSVANEGVWRQEYLEEIWEKWLKEEGQVCFNFHNAGFDIMKIKGGAIEEIYKKLTRQ